jgi:hypothetical protein
MRESFILVSSDERSHHAACDRTIGQRADAVCDACHAEGWPKIEVELELALKLIAELFFELAVSP